jgi:hypothetical protein
MINVLLFFMLSWAGILVIIWTDNIPVWRRAITTVFFTILILYAMFTVYSNPVPLPKYFVPKPHYIMHLEVQP